MVIYWSGYNDETKRVWGYFVDQNIHSAAFGQIKLVQTFWGRKNGNLYFQVTPNTVQFQKTAAKKAKKYKFTKGLEDHLRAEYDRYVVIKKLKGEYE
jgi:hypothetical protein